MCGAPPGTAGNAGNPLLALVPWLGTAGNAGKPPPPDGGGEGERGAPPGTAGNAGKPPPDGGGEGERGPVGMVGLRVERVG